MSRHVVVIAAYLPGAPEPFVYAISVASQPRIGLSTLQAFCPLHLTLVHAIQSDSRTDDLERTLHIKYHAQLAPFGDFWFTLAPADVAYLKTITADNLIAITGLIKRQLAKPAAYNGKNAADFVKEQLALCDDMIAETERLRK